MKNDLDRLMQERGLDALVVSGPGYGNPPLYYMTNGARISLGHVVKRRGAEPVLIAHPMERDEASEAELPVILNTRYDYAALLREHAGDEVIASAAYLRDILADQGITAGRVGFYGMQDQGAAYALLTALARLLPALEIVGEPEGNNVLTAARATKSPQEAARIAEVGRRTIAVVEATVAFLQQHGAGPDEILRRDNGEALTVGHVHAHIRAQLAAQGLEDPEGFIFAAGRDAGIPHSKGTPDHPLRLGESIVFDIFPREAGGGYFFDMTRTFCLGYAPEPVARLHADTLACLRRIYDALEPGQEVRAYQRLACAVYREQGHATLEEAPDTLEGYVHGLGHGVGLNIHEAPSFLDLAGNTACLQAGHVFTIEPGLYYPEQGMGCRLEDTLWLDADGVLRNLTPYPYELVIPLAGD